MSNIKYVPMVMVWVSNGPVHFLEARAVIKFVLRAVSTLETTNSEQRALRWAESLFY